ncbi:hypothetical protein FAUST_8068 [Fusarium austroamericanum]|uniref:CHAT domain-containing protein n=1 Tax=Fusarium austroamericanum TaxID=282268 RepID=A0AAN6BY84_FUSAU|nr:hypothetical protein FAUST_8068 [Fusarium austroamericanum]
MHDPTVQAPERGEKSESDTNSPDDDQELALASYMNSLALELHGHYHDISGEEQTLEDAADMARTSTLVTSDQDPNLSRYYNDLGLILWDLYHHNGCDDALEQAIAAARKAVEITPKVDLDRLRYLDTLSYILYDDGNGRESFEAAKEVVQDCPESHEHRHEYVDHFGRVLYDLTVYTKSLDELEQGLDTVRQSVYSIPAEASYRAQCLSTLSQLLHEQYGVRKGNVDPTEAVQLARDALAAHPEDSLDRATYLHRLGNLLSETFHFTRARSDIEESVKLLRQATSETYDDDAEWASRSFDLAFALESRSAATGSLEDLSESIAIAQKVLEMSPDDHERRLKRSLRLASRLKERHLRTGAQSDFDEAIQVVETNLALAPEDDPDRGRAFHILGNAIGERFCMMGSMDDLDESIRLAQKAVQVTPDTYYELPLFLMSLGSGLTDRYDRTGRLADLEEGIRIWERALDQTPDTALSWIGLVFNLAGSYRNRFERLGTVFDLERCIEFSQKTVDKSGRGDASRHMYLARLASSLKHRFNHYRSIKDIDTAINLGKESLKMTPTGHVDYSLHLQELAQSMSIRWGETKDEQDLKDAIVFERRALDAMDTGHRQRAESLFNMGSYLLKRESVTGNEDDTHEAAQLFEEAIKQTQSSVKSRIEAARRLTYIYMSQGDWQRAYDAAVAAIDMIPQLLLRSLGNNDKQELLKKLGGTSSDAAALALNLGEGPMVALDMLERGRGLLAASIDDLHTDVDALRKELPDMAERFVSLRNQLGRDDMPQQESDSRWNQASNKRHEAGEKFDKLIAEIRQQPGFENFLLPLTEASIKQAAESGPIIVVNTSMLRCDAIIIETHDIRVVPLPGFSRREMTKHSRDGTIRSSLALEWLWNCIAKPVLDALGFIKTPETEWPHVWWVMTGLLSKFPIHAAGEHSHGSSNTVLDRVISSYQTSVQSIIRGRKRPFEAKSPEQALLVGMEATPGSSFLPNAAKEVDAVRQVCESMLIKTVQPEPVKAAITSHLLQSEIFHYAGHAYTDGHDPAESYLCLEANKADCLTVSNLLDINLQRQSPFLAYLSACGTGEIQNEDLTDEGTLWAVMDSLCVHFARLLYEYLRDHGTTDRAVAEGLHHAARKLRDKWLDREDNERALSKRLGIFAPRQINRLAAEQDLEILDIQAELERVKANLEMLKAKRNTSEWLTIAVLVLIIGIMFAGKRF